jgi:hypothetical protein
MNELSVEHCKFVGPQLECFLDTLRGLKSSAWGGPSGIASPSSTNLQQLASSTDVGLPVV